MSSDDFELFGLTRRFEQDVSLIDEAWRRLQSAAHPDRVAGDPVAQRLAMQASVRINEAHRRLRDPAARAAYLCELAGHAPVMGRTPADTEFLGQQMVWREAIAEARLAQDLDDVAAQVRAAEQGALCDLTLAIDNQMNMERASDIVVMLQFLNRLQEAIERRRDDLDTADLAAG